MTPTISYANYFQVVDQDDICICSADKKIIFRRTLLVQLYGDKCRKVCWWKVVNICAATRSCFPTLILLRRIKKNTKAGNLIFWLDLPSSPHFCFKLNLIYRSRHLAFYSINSICHGTFWFVFKTGSISWCTFRTSYESSIKFHPVS